MVIVIGCRKVSMEEWTIFAHLFAEIYVS